MLWWPQLGAIGHRGYIYSYGSRNLHGTNFFQAPTTEITFQVRSHALDAHGCMHA